jgi:hypothetical protein
VQLADDAALRVEERRAGAAALCRALRPDHLDVCVDRRPVGAVQVLGGSCGGGALADFLLVAAGVVDADQHAAEDVVARPIPPCRNTRQGQANSTADSRRTQHAKSSQRQMLRTPFQEKEREREKSERQTDRGRLSSLTCKRDVEGVGRVAGQPQESKVRQHVV